MVVRDQEAYTVSHSFLFDARVWRFLQQIDEDCAARCKAAGCPYCGGRLHQASYPRKPRGMPRALLKDSRRFSFCCAEEGCRRRTTPPSVRFFGRRVYLGPVFLFVTAMSHQYRGSQQAFCEVFGCAERTIKRWRRWWRTTFVQSPAWQLLRGHFVPAISPSVLPASLIERLRGGTYRARLLRAVVLLSNTLSKGVSIPAEDVSVAMF